VGVSDIMDDAWRSTAKRVRAPAARRRIRLQVSRHRG